MNHYKAIEKKAEHGGGWAFMQLNRRAGAAIACACTWEDEGHETAEDAERCFYEAQQSKGVQWLSYGKTAHECAKCGEWTVHALEAASNLLMGARENVCRHHFDTDDEAAAWLWGRHPFRGGIEITASW